MAGNQPLRILQVCSAREAIYGAVHSLMTLARAQRAAGDAVEFLTFAGKRFGAQVSEEGFAVHEVKVRAKIDPIAVLQMRGVIKAGKYDVVHTHLSTSSVNGCLAARAARVPAVATVHGMSGRLSFFAADQMIAVSSGVRDHLVSQGVDAKRVTVVYNGLDLEPSEVEREEVRNSLGYGPDDFVLGTVSRITPLKGIEDALRAMASIGSPRLRYLVVGDGDGLEPCKALAHELGIAGQVDFVGYHQDVARYLSAMDLFVFPTHKEAMGLALLEAMSAGLAAVSTNVGGIPEVATDQTAILVSAGNPGALAAGIKRVLDDPAARCSMAAAAKERAHSVFSIESMRSATDDVYRTLIS